MKNSHIIINVIFALAIITLYVINFITGQRDIEVKTENIDNCEKLQVAFVKVDSIIMNYKLAQNLNEDFNRKQDAYNKEYYEKRLAFEKEATTFQEKMNLGGYLTQERAIEARNKLLSQEEEIKKLDSELSGELARMQAKINNRIVDSISSFLKSYNINKKYDFILKSSGILEGKEKYNITGEVLEGLNARLK